MIRSWARETGIPRQVLPEHARAGTEGDLARATAQPGITIAAHSWSHPNLARLEKSDLDDELCRPIDWLHKRFPNAVSWLAYPYRLTSPAVERAVVAAGYDGAVLLGGAMAATPATSAETTRGPAD